MAETWAKGDLSINGVEIFDENLTSATFNDKLTLLNSKSAETGVTASASFSKAFGIDTANLGTGSKFRLNGHEITMTNGTIAGLVTDVNAQKAVTGIQAEANGNNVTLFGENIQTVTIGYDSATVVTNGLTSAVNAVQSAATDDRTITIAAAGDRRAHIYSGINWPRYFKRFFCNAYGGCR